MLGRSSRKYLSDICKNVSILLALSFVLSTLAIPWQGNQLARIIGQIDMSNVFQFSSNSSTSDHFRVLVQSGNSLLVGGRNMVYNLSVTDLAINQVLEWYSEKDTINMCILKGKTEETCQNYIRIIAKTGPEKLLVCGTNSFKPLCREYAIEEKIYSKIGEKPGQAICPYDPFHNSTFVYVDDELYTGTVADFAGTDPIIYRGQLQTEQYDSMGLNAPSFVNALTKGDFVYFFFREVAIEHTNCGKVVFSRVARVCKHDRGGPHRFRNRWTSFLKTRLNCSIHGEFPFYFNEMQSTSDWVDGTYGKSKYTLIYAVFTTPVNSISGSAVCAFSLQDITDAFEGNFKQQEQMNSNWLPVPSTKVPEPRPGQCVNDSKSLPDQTLSFIKSHFLMDEAVPAFFKHPLVIRTLPEYRFTCIAVDPQILTARGHTYDVLFIGTDNGRVLKAINTASPEKSDAVNTVIIEEIQVFSPNVSVRNLRVVKWPHSDTSGRLIVVSDNQVLSIPLHRCDSNGIISCRECVSLQDPYCVWDKTIGKCRALSPSERFSEVLIYQSVETGVHPACSSRKFEKEVINLSGLSSSLNTVTDTMNRDKDDEADIVIGENSSLFYYSTPTVVFGLISIIFVSLAIGFTMGYICAKKCGKDDEDNIPYPDTEYEYFEQRQNLNVHRMGNTGKLLPQDEVTYAEPVIFSSSPKPRHHGSPRTTPVQHEDNPLSSQFHAPGVPGGENYYPTLTGNYTSHPLEHFNTMRSTRDYSQNDNPMNALDYKSSFGTMRSSKKVYL